MAGLPVMDIFPRSMMAGVPITELFPNMRALQVKPGLRSRIYIDDIRTISAEKVENEEDLEDKDDGKGKGDMKVNPGRGREKRPEGTRGKEREPEPKVERDGKDDPEGVTRARPTGANTPKRKDRGAATMSNSPKIMSYMIRNKEKSVKKEPVEERNRDVEVTTEIANNYEVTTEGMTILENEAENEEQNEEDGEPRPAGLEVGTELGAANKVATKSTTDT